MNKATRFLSLAIVGLLAMTANADPAADAKASSPEHHDMMKHHHMMMHDRPFMMVVHRLDLTDDQRKQIHAIVEKSEAQEKSTMANHKDMQTGLMSPGDANYANSVQAAKDAAVAHIESTSQDNVAIYSVLTADQKAKIPQIIDEMKKHMEDHHQKMKQHHDDKGQKPGSSEQHTH